MFQQNRFRLIGVAVIVFIMIALPVHAQGGPSIPLAVVTQGQVYLYGMGAVSPQPVNLPAGVYQWFGDLTWSPDGSTLAFVALDQNYEPHLLLTDTMGSEPVVAADEVSGVFPISFTADGQVLFAVSTGQLVENEQFPVGGEVLDIYTVALLPGQVPTLVGSVIFGAGCGGGSSIPVHWRYWDETDSGPSHSPMVLALTPYGLVHSINCTGFGTALLDLTTGTDTEIGTRLGWVSVAPDGGQLVGISQQYAGDENGGLVLVNLSNLVSTELPSAAVPDLVTWGLPGSSEIFYSTVEKSGRAVPTAPEDQQTFAEAIGYMEPTTMDINVVSIHRQSIVTGEDVELYRGEAYAVGRIAPLPGGGLVFSQIPNVEAWVEGILNGTIDPRSDDSMDAALHVVPVSLFYLDPNTNAVSLIGMDLNRAAVNVGLLAQ